LSVAIKHLDIVGRDYFAGWQNVTKQRFY
jgi:hypothetical protein